MDGRIVPPSNTNVDQQVLGEIGALTQVRVDSPNGRTGWRLPSEDGIRTDDVE